MEKTIALIFTTSILVLAGCSNQPSGSTATSDAQESSGADKQNTATVATATSTEQIIHQYRNSPVGKSIEPIARSLSGRTVFAGTEGLTPTQDGKIKDRIRLKCGSDNQGREWVYVYTSRAEFGKAFPEGGPFVEMAFPQLFALVEKDQRFGGILLNSASDFYPIPRELFSDIRQVLDKPIGEE